MSIGLRTKKIVLFAGIMLLLLLPTGTVSAASRLQQDADALRNAGNVGVLARVSNNGHVTAARAGTAIRGLGLPVPYDAHYRAGSITKTFVATTLLQLEGEGKLSLDDTVDHWLPGVITGNGNDGAHITVRQLLNNTSGLFDYTTDDDFFATVSTPESYFVHRFHHYSPADLIAIALNHEPYFTPGTDWAYSNTNFVVAGEVIKAVTGHDWSVEVAQRIINPLGLQGTYAPGDNPLILGKQARGYHIFTADPAQRMYTDTTEDNMSWAGAAGALVTTAKDENTFFSALLAGHVLPPAQLAEMKTVVPLGDGIGYGLGIVSQQLSCMASPIWWHNGGTVGYATWSGTTDNGSHSLALMLSTTTFADEDYAIATGELTDALVTHEFCGSSTSAAQTLSDAPAKLPQTLRTRHLNQ